MSEEFKILQEYINELSFQVLHLTIKNAALETLVLGREFDKAPDEYNSVHAKYIDVIEKLVNDKGNFADIFVNPSPSYVRRKEFELFEFVQFLKRQGIQHP